MLIGNAEGKLHVRRQVEDYAFRSVEFEMMGFLSFTVETYERRMVEENAHMEGDEDEEASRSSRNQYGRYLNEHPRSTTHTRVRRSETHNFLPNIVGSWLPRRDGEEGTRPYYFAAMLAFLKPWRNFHDLMTGFENWETAFNSYMQHASQRDRDVVAGCQYFYDSRSSARNNQDDEEIHADEGNDETIEVDDDIQIQSLTDTVRDYLFLRNEEIKFGG
jgi:hypothetical protein